MNRNSTLLILGILIVAVAICITMGYRLNAANVERLEKRVEAIEALVGTKATCGNLEERVWLLELMNKGSIGRDGKYRHKMPWPPWLKGKPLTEDMKQMSDIFEADILEKKE